ncbi:hypothetical protein GCM10023195_34430 [Actinoallomurus liliacearum]|uniref:Glycosyltransferase RgtA/B/C/D-like domain-containing protein n=1 Tax=Actinoallomurus liliacearum TaxID=1080073 RepID=A0ABP8TKG4_9ACTN
MTNAGERGGSTVVTNTRSDEEPQVTTVDENVTEKTPAVSGFGLRALMGRHKIFTVVLAGGALLRLIATLGYRPAAWFNDSFDYLHVAMAPYPHPIRPDGYSFLLWILKPFHSFMLVATIQHLMGLASAVMIYAVLRKRFRLPGWGASLATVPVLYDGYQIQLEHLILSDTTFGFLLVSIVTLLLWHGRDLTWKTGALAGLLLGLATLTRTVGTPVLAAVVVYFLVRRIKWRVIVATVAVCALPLAAYAGWFWSYYGKPGMTMSSGVFLYARVSAFADCNKIKPPVTEYALCKNNKTSHTPLVFSQDAIWNRNSPFHRIPAQRFTDYQNQLASDFAKRAIIAQPLDYLRVVGDDFLFTFRWKRTVFPDRATYEMYQFSKKSAALPTWRMSKDKTAAAEAHSYEQGNARTKIVDPWATIIRTYQRFVHLPGTLLGGILIVGLAGLIPLWRRWGGAALLPWITATGLLLVPPATAEFDYRYVLPTVPLACIAAAITFSDEPRRKLARMFRRRGGAADAESTSSSSGDAVPA